MYTTTIYGHRLLAARTLEYFTHYRSMLLLSNICAVIICAGPHWDNLCLMFAQRLLDCQ